MTRRATGRMAFFPWLYCVLLLTASACSGVGSPARPEDLTATSLNQYEVELTWTCTDEETYWYNWDYDAPAVSYFVYRDGDRVASVNDPWHTDLNLVPDTLYCYRVTSFWDEGITDWIFLQESRRSAEACAWTYPLNTVTGAVTLDSSGLPGVLVELIHDIGMGGVLGSTFTDAEGGYIFTGLENSRYVLDPSMPGFTFSPPQRTVILFNASASQQDFTAYPEP
ncbi:MAG: hypothetical protein JSV00_02025 [bacterium]|nr:MAG: hypothetical protein JSV00_02025 [bacterium]